MTPRTGKPGTATHETATRWVALLRGVNVGGATVRSADLAALFTELGFGAVKTVLATGNVVFDSDVEDSDTRAIAALTSKIQDALSTRFGYHAWIVLLTRDALAATAQAYPFTRRDDVEHPYLVFGSTGAVLDELLEESTEAIRGGRSGSSAGIEEIARGDGCLYWRLPRGHSTDTPVAKVTAKKKYRSGTTTRNLRTVEKIAVA